MTLCANQIPDAPRRDHVTRLKLHILFCLCFVRRVRIKDSQRTKVRQRPGAPWALPRGCPAGIGGAFEGIPDISRGDSQINQKTGWNLDSLQLSPGYGNCCNHTLLTKHKQVNFKLHLKMYSNVIYNVPCKTYVQLVHLSYTHYCAST